jgi:2-acylglycerol O-acyltransferase 2
MATATANGPLSAEPSNPDERKSQHLEPKSYVDAVQEALQLSNGSTNTSDGQNGVNGVNGVDGESQDMHANDSLNGLSHQASIFRIVDIHGEGENTKAPQDEGTNIEDGTEPRDQSGRPGIERQESQREHSATVRIYQATSATLSANVSPQGVNETPETLPRHRHKKTPSQKSNNGTAPNAEKTATFEKFEDYENGNQLTSVKPSGNYEKSKTRNNSERLKVDTDHRTLVSGRQAGKRWQTSGIRFAPMNVPLQRRLQTLMVLFHSTCIALCVSTFFFLCAIPIFWPLLIVYMIYCMSSNAAATGVLKRRSNFFRASPLWSLFASYFPARLHRSEELPPTRKYIFGYHPHGIISHGAFAAFGTEALGFSQLFPGITNTLLTLDSNFRIPIYRDYALAMGLASVSRESCENLLSKGGPNGGESI